MKIRNSPASYVKHNTFCGHVLTSTVRWQQSSPRCRQWQHQAFRSESQESKQKGIHCKQIIFEIKEEALSAQSLLKINFNFWSIYLFQNSVIFLETTSNAKPFQDCADPTQHVVNCLLGGIKLKF